MSSLDQPVVLLNGAWDARLADLLDASKESLLIASPFISRRAMAWVGDCLSKKPLSANLKIMCLTNLRLESVLSGSLELEAITEFGNAFPNFAVTHLPSLHAKVFIADSKCAIVTSGNLTDAGLRRNCEYGVYLSEGQIVKAIRHDFDEYALLGAPLAIPEIQALNDQLAGPRAAFQANSGILTKDLRTKFSSALARAEEAVLRFRARANSQQGIFKSTILYLLAKSPLRTSELHPLIQQLHPDMCDDAVDRMIDGTNFGKKWKHYVRSAQQALKRDGSVVFDGERWHLRPD